MGTISNEQPSLGLTELVVFDGEFPFRQDWGGETYAGSIGFLRLFAGNFAFNGTLLAWGQTMSINQNSALFSLLGTMYGGDGRSTFNLPNLSSALSIGVGQGPGLNPQPLGAVYGSDQLAINRTQAPVAVGGGAQPIDNEQRQAAFHYVIDATEGFYGNNHAGMITRFAGNFTPAGFLEADGSVLQIEDYPMLFSVIGTTYGGNGETTFALPDLRGRTPVGASVDHPLGSAFGSTYTTLTTSQLPISEGGTGAPVNNVQPSLAVNYIISVGGMFPSRDAGGAGGDETFLGEVMAFAGSTIPEGWVLAAGQTMPIQGNQALFALLGTHFGGDGFSNFKLPDLSGRAVQGVGGLNNDVELGEKFGSETFTLNAGDVPIAAPVNFIPAVQTVAEDGALVLSVANGSALGVTGLGGAYRTVTVSATHGALTPAQTTGLSVTFNSEASLTFYGKVSDINAALNGLTYTPAADYHGAAVITLATTASSGSDQDTVTITVTAVDETFTGDNLANVLTGTAENDTLNGAGGDDRLVASAGSDRLNGGAGVDTADYSALTGPVKVNLGIVGLQEISPGKFDWLTGMENAIGTAGDDKLYGNIASNLLIGGDGDDLLNGVAGADIMEGGRGEDTYWVDNAGDVIRGELAGAEIDTVYAVANYSIATVANVERLYGANGDGLTLTGNALANGMMGGAGADTLIGGAGADRLNGLAGADVLQGGTGADTYWVDNAGDVIQGELAGVEIDVVLASVSYSIAGASNVERLTADSDSGLTLTGNTLANLIVGRGGDDVLLGGGGADTLQGGAGADRLDGGAGRDVLTGGAGADTFVFSGLRDSISGARDVIADFEQGMDVIDLSGLFSAGFHFIGDGAFTRTAGELRQFTQGGDTVVTGDINGDGLGDVQLVVSGLHTLTSADFVL